MIETSYLAHSTAPQGRAYKTLHMVDNERMAGRIPSWEEPQTGTDKIAASLTRDTHIQDVQGAATVENALTYAPPSHATVTQNEEFSFADLLDMINPLQHIPVVGSVYRHVTGDEIKPISRIIGGAAFGGALGAASGLVSVIAEQETGDDIAGNIIGFATGHRTSRTQDILSEPSVVAMTDLRHTELYSRHPYQYND